MKRILFALLIILAISIIQSRRHASRHLKSQHKNKKTLPTTPKGHTLHNYFGTSKSKNYYGPKYVKPNQPYLGVDGHKQLWDTKVPEGCDIREASYYQVCDSVFECDLCARIQQCGWCQSLGACLPNCAKGECPFTFVFDRKQCVNTITKGCNPLPNVAPDATHFINPELDDVAKQQVNLKEAGIQQKEEKYVAGYNHKREMVTAHDPENNRVFDAMTATAVPKYGTRMVNYAASGTSSKTLRAEDGAELAVDPGMFKLHGVNQVADRRRKFRKIRFNKRH